MSAPRQSIHELVDQARGRLTRLSPAQARQAQQAGAVLVYIRPQASRELEGELPGAVVIERTVLEWRLDPAGDARLPIADREWFTVSEAAAFAGVTVQAIGNRRQATLLPNTLRVSNTRFLYLRADVLRVRNGPR